jgi:phosphoglycerol transferase MdoB-like AlkP superfamily enzyme
MAYFTVLRILLLLLNFAGIIKIPLYFVLHSFKFGLGFDTLILCYIFSLPFILYFVFSFAKRSFRWLNVFTLLYVSSLFIVCIFISCADIPWFQHQQTRITTASLQWTDSPLMMCGIIFEDIHNLTALALFLLLAFTFVYFIKKIYRNNLLVPDFPKTGMSVAFYLLAGIFIFFGMRGRIALKSPMRWGSAFISEFNLTNQLGLNPVYTFLQSWIDDLNVQGKNISYMNDSDAMKCIDEYYTIQKTDSLDSPLRRKINFEGAPKNYNIVLVLMESMTAYNLKAFGDTNNLTPVLDRLYHQSVSFNHFYSDGIHTFCGVYSSLFGLPSLPNHHHMKDLKNQQPYGGLARTLSSQNYHTIFFTSHDDQFDNMGGFLSSNGFNEIVSQKDYPPQEILNTLGIPDHELFAEAKSRLDRIAKKGQHFFATILTSSNHGPYELPKGISFKPHSDNKQKQLIEYADWSIGKFLEACSAEAWSDSTIFIFTGDHGAIIESLDMYMTYHRVPFMIYAPKIFQPVINGNLGGQIDIYPTILSILNRTFLNNSFGIDILHSSHSLITFSYDDEYGSISGHDFCVRRKDKAMLFEIDPTAKHCPPVENQSRLDSLLNYANAVMQTKQNMMVRKQLN